MSPTKDRQRAEARGTLGRMRGAPLSIAVLALASFGCSSGGACLLDSDCADFAMVCIERQCVSAGAIDGGERDGGPVEEEDDAGSAAEDAGTVVADGGASDGSTPDSGAPPCADLTGAWTVTPSDPATCAGGMSTFPLSFVAGASVCEFTAGAPLAGTITVAMDGALSGTLAVNGEEVECTGNVAETVTMTCGACEFTLAR